MRGLILADVLFSLSKFAMWKPRQNEIVTRIEFGLDNDELCFVKSSSIENKFIVLGCLSHDCEQLGEPRIVVHACIAVQRSSSLGVEVATSLQLHWRSSATSSNASTAC